MMRYVLAVVGGLALMNLLATVMVELFAMAGVTSGQFDERVSSKDFWLMFSVIGVLTIAGILMLGAYADLLLLGSRFPRSRVLISIFAIVTCLAWLGSLFAPMHDFPLVESYLSGHVATFLSGAIAGGSMLLLSKVPAPLAMQKSET